MRGFVHGGICTLPHDRLMTHLATGHDREHFSPAPILVHARRDLVETGATHMISRPDHLTWNRFAWGQPPGILRGLVRRALLAPPVAEPEAVAPDDPADQTGTEPAGLDLI